MLNVIAGLVIFAATVALFWYVRPQNGEPHRLATAPVIATTLPLTITAGLVFGAMLVIAGLFGSSPF